MNKEIPFLFSFLRSARKQLTKTTGNELTNGELIFVCPIHIRTRTQHWYCGYPLNSLLLLIWSFIEYAQKEFQHMISCRTLARPGIYRFLDVYIRFQSTVCVIVFVWMGGTVGDISSAHRTNSRMLMCIHGIYKYYFAL